MTGSNDYMIQATLCERQAQFSGAVERVDGVDLDFNRLADLLAGGGLFAIQKLVIISDLSGNKTIWPVLADWLKRVDDDTELILVEPKLDKRTTTYKSLKTLANIKEFNNWIDRDQNTAIQWAIEEAGKRDMKLDRASAAELVRRCLVATDKPGRAEIDQWRLHFGLEKLRVVEAISPAVVAELVEAEPRENSFELLELALAGRIEQLQSRLAVLRHSEEPHRLFGLLSGQIYQLAVVVHANKPLREVAAETGVHPFVLEKLQPPARRTSRTYLKELVSEFSKADRDMKSTGQDAWQTVESLLLGVAARSSQ